MARVRILEVNNFRSVKYLSWTPSSGFNCLIGPGDSGKSTILEAIDYCLGARRNINFSDADFHNLNIDEPIRIIATVGELDDSLKGFDNYGLYLRGFNMLTGELEDEPGTDLETVVSVKLEVQSDLEPSWSLVSDRAMAQGQSRPVQWADRVKLAPTRIGAVSHHNLGWQRGSILNRVTGERADASSALAKAARDVRAAFSEDAAKQLGGTLEVVTQTAKELGVPVGSSVKAMLDAHSVSFVGGTVSLHDEIGVPLRGLGLGSTRLLIAGLQRKASDRSSVVLVDELEHGLEPHRIIRFVNSLGSKEATAPLQVFATSHSPVALRELSIAQLGVVRKSAERHEILTTRTDNDLQGIIRTSPEAFLAGSVYVCEGASEVGLIRGLDQFAVARTGRPSIYAAGSFLVDAGGCTKIYRIADVFQRLGYKVATLRDDDVQPTPESEKAFTDAGGTVFMWRNGLTTEDELFRSVSDDAVVKLVAYACELHTEETINSQISSASGGQYNLSTIQQGQISPELRQQLGAVAKSKKSPWFKTITDMEYVGREIVGPDIRNVDRLFAEAAWNVIVWSSNA